MALKDQKDKQNAHQPISVLVGPPHHLLNLLQGVVNCWLLVKQFFLPNSLLSIVSC